MWWLCQFLLPSFASLGGIQPVFSQRGGRGQKYYAGDGRTCLGQSHMKQSKKGNTMRAHYLHWWGWEKSHCVMMVTGIREVGVILVFLCQDGFLPASAFWHCWSRTLLSEWVILRALCLPNLCLHTSIGLLFDDIVVQKRAWNIKPEKRFCFSDPLSNSCSANRLLFNHLKVWHSLLWLFDLPGEPLSQLTYAVNNPLFSPLLSSSSFHKEPATERKVLT